MPRSLSLLCFQLAPPEALADLTPEGARERANALTKRLEDLVNQRGIFVIHTDLAGQYVIRFVPGSPWTTDDHVRAAFDLFQRTATEVLSSDAPAAA